MISPTYKTGFKTNAKGNILFMESNSNGSRKSPILNAIVNGKSVNNRLNFLANLMNMVLQLEEYIGW